MIVFFEEYHSENNALLGLKGASLCDMTKLGLNVPPGFIIPVEAGKNALENGELSAALFDEIKSGIAELEKRTDRWFGGNKPLLLSVRSGAGVPMPGMMDTILNVGMNESVLQALIHETMNEKFAYDCWRRFTQMYAEIVLDCKKGECDKAMQDMLTRAGVFSEDGLDASSLKKITENFRSILKKSRGADIPSDPYLQLRGTIQAIFKSWENPRAVVFRRFRRIKQETPGTAVIVQSMVYGNQGENSGTGVFATRDPITGENRLFGEFLINAQGEDVLSGARTPKKIDELKTAQPHIYDELQKVAGILENYYRDVQEIEFTIERGKLYFLQTRSAGCTVQGKIKSVVDMAKSGLLSREEAVLRIEPDSLGQILHSHIDPGVQIRSVMRGMPASPGAAFGAVVFTTEDAVEMKKQSLESILVRIETATEDIAGMEVAAGLLTERGGMTSHAAVIARRMGIPCVTGCENIHVDPDKKEILVDKIVIRQGDIITIDGSSGRVFLGAVPMRKTTISTEFQELMSWCDEFRMLKVRANADIPEDVERALEFGADGIGLCRTEAMFMAADRLPTMRAMILEEKRDKRDDLLLSLRAMQKKDFLKIFKNLKGKPITIRLLDPPLHEFLPNIEDLIKEVAIMRSQGFTDETSKNKEELLTRVLSHQETNPMLGLRGCRLAIVSPEIVEMQIEAIFEAACELSAKDIPVNPEILIPLVGHVKEFEWLRERLEVIARKIIDSSNSSVQLSIGVLIEIPRAALTAARLARSSDFFSFGTNDLTQTTFGFSRDDSEQKFLHYYRDQNILEENPFEVLDIEGVGRLVKIAVEDGRSVKPNLVMSLCGEQGGEPRTIDFCHSLGLNFISCSPYRIPIARLAAAQANLKDINKKDFFI